MTILKLLKEALFIISSTAVGAYLGLYLFAVSLSHSQRAQPPAVATATVTLPSGVQAAIDQLTADLDGYTESYGSLQADSASLAALQTIVNNDQAATNGAQTAVTLDETALAAAIAGAYGQGPMPAPQPAPTPPATASNLRVLFSYDPMGLAAMSAAQQTILTSPALRGYLDKHCPLEGACPTGHCPLTAGKSASYRFLPIGADTSKLAPVWQTVAAAAAKRSGAWLLAIDENGKTVIDQAWPASVDETLKLLRKFGGP